MQILWDFGMFSVSLGVELKRSYNRDISSPIDCKILPLTLRLIVFDLAFQ